MLPPLSDPCPSRLLHPARCAQGLLLGVEVWQLDMALLLAVAAASIPRTSRKKRAFPLMSGGPALCGGVSSHHVHAVISETKREYREAHEA